MDYSNHNLNNLFAQLGLANSTKEITKFIESHKGLEANIKLSEADFWSQGQKAFINEALVQDSDWSEIVDTLDTLLRK